MGCCCGKTRRPLEVYTAFVEDLPDVDVKCSMYKPPTLVTDDSDIYCSTDMAPPLNTDTYDIYSSTYRTPPLIAELYGSKYIPRIIF